MKKNLYYLVASVSFLGVISSQTVFTPQVVQANDFRSQKGTFVVGSSVLNVRSAPNTGADIVASYQPGQKVNYDQIGTANGFRWISYVGGSGNRNYVAIGSADGVTSYGSLMNDEASSVSEQESVSFGLEQNISTIAGHWSNSKGRTVTISLSGQVIFDDVSGSGQITGFNNYPNRPNEISFNVGFGNTGFGGLYVPAGVGFAPNAVQVDDSDQTKERLLFAQGTMSSAQEIAFYRVEEGATEKSFEPEDEVSKDNSSQTGNKSKDEKEESSDLSDKEKEDSRISVYKTSKRDDLAKVNQGITLPTVASNIIREFYKNLTGRQELPSTGETVTVLSLIGAGVITSIGLLKYRGLSKKELENDKD